MSSPGRSGCVIIFNLENTPLEAKEEGDFAHAASSGYDNYRPPSFLTAVLSGRKSVLGSRANLRKPKCS